MKINKDIIKKLVAGESTEEELKFLESYLKSDDTKELENLIYDEWSADTIENSSKYKEDDIWLLIKSKIRKKEKKKKDTGRTHHYKSKRTYTFFKYAAIFVGVTLLSAVFYQNQNAKTTQPSNQITIKLDNGTLQTIRPATRQFITNVNGDSIAKQEENRLIYNDDTSEELAFNTLYVPYGKKFQVVLSDGSVVYLNSGSSLKYPIKFIKGNSREVFLEGEGHFTIAKDKSDSFIVNTNDISTKVFGTQFNISAYENEGHIKVVLVEGSVSVYKTKDGGFQNNLKPDQIASYAKAESKITTDQVDISSHIAWVDGVLLFKNENFNTIARKLERHYDIEITNHYGKLESERFTGRFEIEDIDEVLNTFKRTTGFSYKKSKNKIIINP